MRILPDSPRKGEPGLGLQRPLASRIAPQVRRIRKLGLSVRDTRGRGRKVVSHGALRELIEKGKLKHDPRAFEKLDLSKKPFFSEKGSAIIYAAIAHMRAEGWTLERIGEKLGMSRQAVWQRSKRILGD